MNPLTPNSDSSHRSLPAGARHGWRFAGAAVALLSAVALAAAEQPTPTTPAIGPPPPPPDGPRIQFAAPTHDFGPLKRGASATHTFVFANTGGAPLRIVDIQATCGCTTLGAWDREVAPGHTGGIPIVLATATLSGAIVRTIQISSTDPLQPVSVLQVSATVLSPIEVTPANAIFHFTTEAKNREARTLRIVNRQPVALTLSEPRSSNAAFRAELRPVTPGQEWDLMISTGPPAGADSVSGVISLKTSAPDMPLLSVPVHAVKQPAVVLTPAQIILSRTPLTAGSTASVTIMGTASHPLVLSEPRLSFAGPEVQLRELQPGRLFSLSVAFPAGFLLPLNAAAALTVKSNYPQHLVIRIPISDRVPSQP